MSVACCGAVGEGDDERERTCPDCGTRAPRPVEVCPSCGVTLCDAVSKLPPEGVVVEEPALVEGEGDPYRELGGPDDTLTLLVAHESRPLLGRMSALAVAIGVIALQLDIGIVPKLAIGALGVAVFAAGLAPRRTPYRLVVGLHGITAGPDGFPAHRCVQVRREHIVTVVARAVPGPSGSGPRYDLLVLDTSGRLHRLLTALEGEERADWLAKRLRAATRSRALEG